MYCKALNVTVLSQAMCVCLLSVVTISKSQPFNPIDGQTT